MSTFSNIKNIGVIISTVAALKKSHFRHCTATGTRDIPQKTTKEKEKTQ